jgi:hypothetical protein
MHRKTRDDLSHGRLEVGYGAVIEFHAGEDASAPSF